VSKKERFLEYKNDSVQDFRLFYCGISSRVLATPSEHRVCLAAVRALKRLFQWTTFRTKSAYF
jgi:hypothetical protein